MIDTHVNSWSKRFSASFVSALFFFGCPVKAAEEAKTFVLDMSFHFDGPRLSTPVAFPLWNPPFVGGPKIALMENGQMIVTRTASESTHSGVMRVNASGGVDESFEAELPLGVIHAVTVDEAGDVYTAMRTGSSNTVVKLNRAGESIWAKEVKPDYSLVTTIVAREDGTVLVGGSFTNIGGANRQSVALLAGDGRVRDEFDLRMDGMVTCVAELSDGSVFLGGDFERVNGELKIRLVKFGAEGGIDERFNPGTGLAEEVTAIGIDGAGGVVVSGHFNIGNGAPGNRLMRLLPDGSVDESFEVGEGLDGAAAAIEFDEANRIVLAGAFTRVSGMLRPRIARLLPNGSLDESYKPGLGLNATASDLLIDGAGKYVVAGYFAKVGHRTVPGIARLLNHSDLRTADFTDEVFITNEQYGETGIHLQRFGDSAGELVARVTLVPGDDPALSEFAPFEKEVIFGPGETFKVVSIPLGDDGLVEGGEFLELRLVVPAAGMESRATIAVRDDEVPVTMEGKFSALDVVFIDPVAAARHGKVAVGGLIGFGSSTEAGPPRGVVVFGEDGVVDPRFGIVTVEGTEERRVRAVDWTADGKLLIGGYFSQVRNAEQRNLTRLNADGSLDTTFRPFLAAVVHLVALPDGKILVSPGLNSSLMRLLPSGQVDASFQGDLNRPIRNMAVQGDGKILVEGEGLPLTRLNPDGRKDPDFFTPFNSGVQLTDIAVSQEGRIYVTGNFSTVQGWDRPGLVRLMPNGTVDLSFEVKRYVPAWNEGLLLKNNGKAIVIADGLVVVNEDGSRSDDFTWSVNTFRPVKPLVELSDGRVLANVEWFQGGGKGLQILHLTNKVANQLVFDTVNLVLKEGTTRKGLEVKRIGDVSNELTAVLSMEDRSAEDLVLPRELKFAARQTSATIDVSAVADGMIEGDEVHLVRVSGPNLVGSDFEVVVFDGNGRPGSVVLDPALQTFANGIALAPVDNDAVVVTQVGAPYLIRFDRSDGSKEVFNALEDFNYGAPRALAVAGGKVLVGGLQIRPRPHAGRLVRLNGDGTVDEAFKEPDLHVAPNFILPQPDGKILLGGEFVGAADVVYNYVLLNSDGTIARKYPTMEPAIHSPAVVDGKLHYHTRTSEHWGTLDRVLTLDLASGLPVGSPLQANGGVRGIVAEAESALIYGAFSVIGGVPASGLARMKNGLIDPTFRPEILPKEVVGAHVDAQGRILVLGPFRHVNGVEAMGMARLLPDGSLDRAFQPTSLLPQEHAIYFRSVVQLGNGDYAALGHYPGFGSDSLVWINGDLPFAGQIGRHSTTSPLNLVFNTVPGKRYQIESSTDFTAWTPVAETNAVGFQIWLDAPVESGVEFFRAEERN